MDKSYEKGQILRLAGGEYDDYRVYAVVKVLKPFNEKEVIQEFFKGNDDPWPATVELMDWLEDHHYIEKMNAQEFHMGRYYVEDYR